MVLDKLFDPKSAELQIRILDISAANISSRRSILWAETNDVTSAYSTRLIEDLYIRIGSVLN